MTQDETPTCRTCTHWRDPLANVGWCATYGLTRDTHTCGEWTAEPTTITGDTK